MSVCSARRPRSAADLPEVLRDPAHRFFEDLHAGEEHDAEMVGLVPVEAAALRDEDLLLAEQAEGKLLVVVDPIDLRVELREDVEGGVRTDGADAGESR
jgi:hypothetical protein